MSLRQSFPANFTPTKTQELVLAELDKFFQSDEKFCILQAPTGSGKTFIAKTVLHSTPEPSNQWIDEVDSYRIYGNDPYSEMFGGFCLTTTKQLQDQYIDTFDDLMLIKGKSNYDCDLDGTCTVDNAPCVGHPNVRKACWSADKCTYYNARKNVLKAKESVLNYSTYFKMGNAVKSRTVLICDEASELEDTIVSSYTLECNINVLKKLRINMEKLDDPNSVKALNWLKSMQSQITSQIQVLKNSETRTALAKSSLKRLSELSLQVNTVIENFSAANYIIDSKGLDVKFVPLYCNTLANLMFRNHDKVILMSATIVDPDQFARTLGIQQYHYIDVPTEFNPKKAPIAFTGCIKLNKASLDQNIGKAIKIVEAILEKHKDSKGIIHTSTHDIAKRIANAIKNPRLLIKELGETNEDILLKHITSTAPTILLSPSMMFGVDLVGDLAKFQIVVKSPYPSLGDKRIFTLTKKSQKWYETKMLVKLVQSCGRGVRTKDDTCVTYILDDAAKRAVIRNAPRLPKYFMDRIL